MRPDKPLSSWDRIQACHSAMRKATACLELHSYAEAMVNLLCAVVHLGHVAKQDQVEAIVRGEKQRRASGDTRPW